MTKTGKTLGPRPLAGVPTAALKRVTTVFFDIDDTFSSHGKITGEAYAALWALHDSGVRMVPVTGRPAGWCDMIARMWPVAAVVGENGAFYAQMKNGRLQKTYLETAAVRAANRSRLEGLRRLLPKAFPGLRFASDQGFREFDLAIDYCEDVRSWAPARVQGLLDYCHRAGAQAKLSSVHVNAWFGRYDKLSCVRRYASRELGMGEKSLLAKAAYLGDSPNDEPFFAHFPLSVGVANVGVFLGRMASAPAYVTRRECGAGFAEFASRLAAARKK